MEIEELPPLSVEIVKSLILTAVASMTEMTDERSDYLDAHVDRWLAEVKAEAWQDGIEAFDAAITRDVDDPWSQLPENPYRQGENSD